jgi:hypothetical protein
VGIWDGGRDDELKEEAVMRSWPSRFLRERRAIIIISPDRHLLAHSGLSMDVEHQARVKRRQETLGRRDSLDGKRRFVGEQYRKLNSIIDPGMIDVEGQVYV